MKVDSLVSIIMILLDKKRIGAKELADIFEVSSRTIYRDIDTINMAGIPVRGSSGVGGGFEIMQKSVIDSVLNYCTYDNFSPNGVAHFIVSFPFIENEYYYNILFSFGDKCECLEPLSIRTEMKRRIHNIATIYENYYI